MNINLKWWQVLGFFALFGGFIWFKTMQASSLEANDIEERINELRHQACDCQSQECADAVGVDLVNYIESVKEREGEAEQVELIQSLTVAAQNCILDPSKRSKPDTSLDDMLLAQLAQQEALAQAWPPQIKMALKKTVREMVASSMKTALDIEALSEDQERTAEGAATCVVDAIEVEKALAAPDMEQATPEEVQAFMTAFGEQFKSELGQNVLRECMIQGLAENPGAEGHAAGSDASP